MIEGPQAGWLSGQILTLFVVAGAALAAFIFCGGRSADPMMDLKLFRDRTYSLAIIAIFAVIPVLAGETGTALSGGQDTPAKLLG